MFHFKRKLNKIRVFIERRNFLFFVIAVICLVFSIILLPKIFKLSVKVVDSFKDKRNVIELKTELENKQKTLEEDWNKLQTDFGIEYEIRDKFPVVKDGEDMVVFVQNKSKNDKQVDLPGKSFWQKLKDLFH